MKLNILIIFLFSIIFPNDNKNDEIPKLELKNTTLNLGIKLGGNIFPNANVPIEILIEAQMDEIKNKAKNFIVDPVNENEIAILETNFGTLKLKLFHNKSPNHCNNFKKLSNSGYYDETLFHRVVPGFLIQGGDLNTRDGDSGNDGQGNPGWTINAEFNDIKHKKGILSMARSNDPNSAGSQFFICLDDVHHLDDIGYTVFGEVIENESILDIIAGIPSESKQMLSMSKTSLPEDSIENDWITYEFNKNILWFKLPPGQTKESYTYYISKRINNIHRPSIPVRIKSLRIVDKNLIIKDSKKNLKVNPYFNLNNRK